MYVYDSIWYYMYVYDSIWYIIHIYITRYYPSLVGKSPHFHGEISMFRALQQVWVLVQRGKAYEEHQEGTNPGTGEAPGPGLTKP